jgi:hypothetical protein
MIAWVTLGIPLLLYMSQAIFGYYMQGRYGMAICFLGYSVANAGLLWDALTHAG